MKDIALENICKSYGENRVLKDVSAVFPAGEASCVTAPSGAGKTTLLRIMMGLEKPDSGMVSGLEGAVMSAVFQEDRLCEGMTAGGNIRLVSPKLPKGELSRAMEEAGLSGCENRPVGELSGGMRRRVALLRAVLLEAGVYFFDEPFKGLDAGTKSAVTAMIKRRLAGKTVILVTHDPAEAAALGCGLELKL